MDEYVRLGSVGDFQGVRIKSYRMLGRLVGIVREPDGTFWATEIACKHQNADLTTGRFEGDEVTCPRHGWKYDIRTGQCLNQNSAPLRRHHLRRIGDELHVSVHPIEAEVPPESPDDAMPEIVFRPKRGS
jgi:nitrite reductase/ring-hydroxylating ferredoxin subunit